MNRRASLLALLLGLILVAGAAPASPSTIVLTVDGMT
jgi:hypothetical protein